MLVDEPSISLKGSWVIWVTFQASQKVFISSLLSATLIQEASVEEEKVARLLCIQCSNTYVLDDAEGRLELFSNFFT